MPHSLQFIWDWNTAADRPTYKGDDPLLLPPPMPITTGRSLTSEIGGGDRWLEVESGAVDPLILSRCYRIGHQIR